MFKKRDFGSNPHFLEFLMLTVAQLHSISLTAAESKHAVIIETCKTMLKKISV